MVNHDPVPSLIIMVIAAGLVNIAAAELAPLKTKGLANFAWQHAADGGADEVLVLAANYDLKLSVDKSYNSCVRSRALVRSGNEIPILLRDFKIKLRLSRTPSKEFLAQMVVYEKSGSGWYQVTIQPLEFTGGLGEPTQYSWESGGMMVDLAIVVGVQ